MPFYNYKAKNPDKACNMCKPGYTEHERLTADPQTFCAYCATPVYRAIQPVQHKVRHTLKGDCRDYRDDLAAYPGDPEAQVDGPRAVQKLVDKRKRQGWHISKDYPTLNHPKLKSPREIAEEAYTRAKDKGFKPDED